jgi:hypothetical protein
LAVIEMLLAEGSGDICIKEKMKYRNREPTYTLLVFPRCNAVEWSLRCSKINAVDSAAYTADKTKSRLGSIIEELANRVRHADHEA